MSSRLTPRPDPVTLVWLGGIALALLAYAVGPERVVAVVLQGAQHIEWVMRDLAHRLTAATISVMRAAAIGLFGSFVGLSLLAMRRHQGAGGGLVVVTVVFLLLVWGADGDGPGSNMRWIAALLLAGLAALSATRRLGGRASGR